MTWRGASAFALKAWCVLAAPLVAQAPGAVEVRAATGPIHLDGVPDEPAWQSADSITDFRQREPVEGRPATERTVIRLLRAPRGLYVALWAYDSQPGAIRRAQLRRDADLESDDSFTLLLDPQRDNRSGHLFSINANGALHDAEVISFESTRDDWDGLWDGRARRSAFGWTAELMIPWRTLRYRLARDVWGANFRRLIRRKNEEVLWHAWGRTEGIVFMAKAGTLSGLSGLPPRGLTELRPYVAASADLRQIQYGPTGDNSLLGLAEQHVKVGGDAKLAVAPTLTLDLTANTDFAQVEADQQVINLTRFPLFFPEKRPFFLESSGIFDFGQSERTLVFYSRRIGLAADGSPVPITVGARLTGRMGRERLGLLAIRTDDPEQAVDLAARVKHDVLSQGYVGAIFTSQSLPGDSGTRLASGADATLPFLLRGQNLVFGSFAAGSRSASGGPTETAWRVYVDYPNDVMDHFIGFARITPGFDPPLGFVTEDANTRFTGHFDFFPRPHRLGIRQLHFQALEWEVIRHLDGMPSHALYTVIPLGAQFESGDAFDISLVRQEDDPTVPFAIFPGDTIAAGRYTFDRAGIQFSSSPARPVGFAVTTSTGEFYSGHSTAFAPSLILRVAPHVVVQLDASVAAVRLPTGGFTARAVQLRLDVATSPRLSTTLFVQSDNESRRLALNGRVHWILRPGSDAYLVYNSAWPTGLPGGVPWGKPSHGTLIGKVVYYFQL